MQIILEGNECVFKSTIAEKLAKETGYKIIKGSSFDIATGSNEDMFRYFVDILQEDNIIIDRYIFSNFVYATLFPAYTILTPRQFRVIEDLLTNSQLERKIIYLYADTATIKERLLKRGDDYIDSSKVHDINNTYDDLWERVTRIRPVMINTEAYTSDEIVNGLVGGMVHVNS